ncbi:hypothetical protein AOQ84DRAFT_209461 [Glonium stellatum]|uniref:Uncharacterized protein n=1 Tax=Glonium stellatum TaxID=574774 RepID=A0A8E2EN75_9PEZI|nr:hypothetical protein AOQ84DRAFT_209461 [Glonium stellatum]
MRNQSPATPGAKFVPPALRGRAEGVRDGGEREGGREREREREREALPSAPPPPAQAPSDGKYRPGAFSRRREV